MEKAHIPTSLNLIPQHYSKKSWRNIIMASVYRKGNMIYISWYDPFECRTKNRSTKMRYSKENLKKANLIAEELQKQIDAKAEEFNRLGIKHGSIASAMEHFMRINGNKHKKTIEEYKLFFKKFTQTFSPNDPVTTINKSSCEEWLISLREYDYQQNTLYSYTKVLKKFLNFLFEYNYVPMFKLNSDVTYKPEVKEVEIFSQEDLQKLLDGLENKNSNFRTTIYLLLYTGLRPSDIYKVRGKDIDFTKKTLKYYSEKTKAYFEVPLHPDLVPILKERVKEVGEGGYLLEYETISNIGKAYRRYLKQIGLDGKNYTLRTFRKTFISLAYNSGMDLAAVSRLVGHKKITTTQKYYTQFSLAKQSEELNKLKLVESLPQVSDSSEAKQSN